MASEREQIRNALLRRFRMIYARRLRCCLVRQKFNARSGKRRIAPRPPGQRDSQHVLNTTRLVNNLLDMARIHPAALI